MKSEITVKIGTFPTSPALEAATFSIGARRVEGFRLRDVTIGIGFHWESTRDFLLCGQPRLADTSQGVALYLTLPLEDYLVSVISSEMNPEAPTEFLKAHAVISRGWALGKVREKHLKADSHSNSLVSWEDHTDHHDCDVCADDHCQRFQGFAQITDAAVEAVAATSGLCLTDAEGRLADTRFSKCCGGTTEAFSTCWEDRDYDYLQPVACPHCDLSSLHPDSRSRLLATLLKDYDRATTDFYRWREHVSSAYLQRRLVERFGTDLGHITSMHALERGRSGRIKLLQIDGSRGSLTIGKELVIRRLLKTQTLYSSAFAIIPDADGFTLHGRGWGHGVGLCQIGAARMAMEGADCQEILNLYYPRTTLQHYD